MKLFKKMKFFLNNLIVLIVLKISKTSNLFKNCIFYCIFNSLIVFESFKTTKTIKLVKKTVFVII